MFIQQQTTNAEDTAIENLKLVLACHWSKKWHLFGSATQFKSIFATFGANTI